MRVRDRVEIPVDPREVRLDPQSALLIENIRRTLKIQHEMFRRILGATSKPSALLAELLEDAGNRYIDFSELVSAAAARLPVKEKLKLRAAAARATRSSYKLNSKA